MNKRRDVRCCFSWSKPLDFCHLRCVCCRRFESLLKFRFREAPDCLPHDTTSLVMYYKAYNTRFKRYYFDNTYNWKGLVRGFKRLKVLTKHVKRGIKAGADPPSIKDSIYNRRTHHLPSKASCTESKWSLPDCSAFNLFVCFTVDFHYRAFFPCERT